MKIVLDLHEPVSGAVVTNTLSCREHFSLEQEIIEMIEAKGLFRQKLISCRHHSSCLCNFEIDVAQNLYDRPAAFQSNTATPFANERGVRCHFLDHPNISWA